MTLWGGGWRCPESLLRGLTAYAQQSADSVPAVARAAGTVHSGSEEPVGFVGGGAGGEAGGNTQCWRGRGRL